MPRGSWLTPIASGLVSVSTVALDIDRRSFPAMRGAAIRHHRLKKARLWVSLIPGIPTIIMSGSFQWPGPAKAASFSLAKAILMALAQSAWPGAQISAGVRQRGPTVGAPRAEPVHDRTSGGALSVVESRIGLDNVLAFCVAPVYLDVVRAPFGELAHVLILVVFGPRHGRAAGPGAGVHLLDELLVLRPLAEDIPWIPAHRRSQGQAVFKGADAGSR